MDRLAEVILTLDFSARSQFLFFVFAQLPCSFSVVIRRASLLNLAMLRSSIPPSVMLSYPQRTGCSLLLSCH